VQLFPRKKLPAFPRKFFIVGTNTAKKRSEQIGAYVQELCRDEEITSSPLFKQFFEFAENAIITHSTLTTQSPSINIQNGVSSFKPIKPEAEIDTDQTSYFRLDLDDTSCAIAIPQSPQSQIQQIIPSISPTVHSPSPIATMTKQQPSVDTQPSDQELSLLFEQYLVRDFVHTNCERTKD
jgi:hypothetical protein